MSHSFTIVPYGDFEEAAAAVTHRARVAHAVVETREGDVDVVFFAGDRATAERCAGEHDAFGCVRILRSSGVLQVDAEGYEGSIEELESFVRWVLQTFAPCRVFDDETGEDLGAVVSRTPIALFRAEPDFEERADE